MIPPKRIEEIENVAEKYGNTYPFFKDIINEIFAERKQLVAIAEAAERIVEFDGIITPIHLEGQVLKALKAWKGSDER